MIEKGMNNLNVRNTNRRRIINLLYRHNGITKQEIARSLGLSNPTVAQILKELSSLGLVREEGTLASSGGRKPARVVLAYDAKYAVGIEITQNHLSFVLIDLAENAQYYRRVRERFENSEDYRRSLENHLEIFLTENHVEREKLLGVGIALPGIVRAESGVLEYSPTLGVHDLSVESLASCLSYPVRMGNEANLAGFSEMWGMEQVDDAAFLSINKGVGGSILIGGRVYDGKHFRSGEFGHMTIVRDGKRCSCGRKGCFEAYCSTTVLTEDPAGDLDGFFAALEKGDAACAQKWNAYLENLAAGINNLRMIFDTDIIVGGSIGPYLEKYEDRLREQLRARNSFGESADYLHISRFGGKASAVGAALLLVDEFLNR